MFEEGRYMKTKLILCSFLALNFLNANAVENSNKIINPIKVSPKVIYGNDDRFDVYESSDSLMRGIAGSTAAMINNDHLILNNGTYTLKSETLAEGGVCKSERFADQMAPADCSGFLVAPDTIVTAGHCITSMNDCETYSWVFDFANNTEEKSAFTFNQKQVYHCTKIIAREKNNSNQNDYAVVKLDRSTGRTPLKFRTEGKVDNNAVLTVIGHPSGLPLKITAAADMRKNTNAIYFVTNADTYGGNSGSAVVDSRTGVVEGILVRGDQDYESNPNGEACSVSVHRTVKGGRGEDVTRITNIKVLKK
jgi:V8-like Glu-specific endopeptidase